MTRGDAIKSGPGELNGRLLRFQENDGSIVEGTIIERIDLKNAVIVEWRDDHQNSRVHLTSPAIVEIL